LGQEAKVSISERRLIVPEITALSLSEINQYQRCDAEFFGPTTAVLLDKIQSVGCQRLGDFLSSAKRGQAPEYNTAGEIPVIRTANVRELEFSGVRQEYVTKDFYDSAVKGPIGTNDFAVTSTGVGTLGRVFCNISGGEYFADGHITILKAKPGVDICLLAAVLQSRIGQVQFERWQRGSSGQIEIYPEDICNILIPKLPAKTQLQISALWRAAVESVKNSSLFYPQAEQELLERLGWQKIKQSADELFFVEGISEITKRGRADPEHFQPKYLRLLQQLEKVGASTLGSLTREIVKGIQPDGYSDEGPITVVKSKNVFGHGIDFVSCQRTSVEAFKDQPSRLAEGDVVMNSTGFGTLGRAAFVPSITEKTVAAVDLLILRLRKDQALPEYVTLFLNSAAGLWQSEMFQTGSSGQLHLYPQHVKEMLVFLPRNKDGSVDLVWQRKLAALVTRASRSKDDARIKLDQAKKIVEKYVNQSGH
jgi:restriction endonuclease S subunit